MKKFFLAFAVILSAIVSFAFVKQVTSVKKAATSVTWYYTGTDEQEITNPDFYSQTGSQTGCGSVGNVPCAIEVPDNTTPGDAEDDLAAFLQQYVNNTEGLLEIALSRKSL